MAPIPPTCPRCHSGMEAGFLLDRGHYDALQVEQWLAGTPEKSFWTGLQTKGRDRFAVSTFRCTGCGYLESYATTKQE